MNASKPGGFQELARRQPDLYPRMSIAADF